MANNAPPPDRGSVRAEARGSSDDSHSDTASEMGAPPLAVILAAGDLDCDNDVDFDDFVEFHAAFTGPLP